MKNKLLIVCAFFCLSSCEGFLDLSPESQPNAKEFYVTENDFNSAVMACYQSLRNYPTIVLDVLEYRSDNMFMPSFTSGSQDKYEINHFQDNKTNSLIADIWEKSYRHARLRCTWLRSTPTALSPISVRSSESATMQLSCMPARR